MDPLTCDPAGTTHLPDDFQGEEDHGGHQELAQGQEVEGFEAVGAQDYLVHKPAARPIGTTSPP